MEPVKNGKPIQSQPMQMSYRGVDTGGVKLGQTYEGVPGFGNLVPMVGPGEIPYYGPWTGGE
ncbi:MAG: hypothetical protein Q8904_15060 [Bacteroidota bacterium]|nr:hypothetical protein [Bacteroidota bacterium]